MIVKLSRQSVLVIISALMILIGLFYYGDNLLIQPLEERAEAVSEKAEAQQELIAAYPPEKDFLLDYESKSSEAEVFIPLNVQANQALINLENIASKVKVSVISLSRVAEQEVLEESDGFAKDTYTAQLTASSPGDLRQLIELLMEQERVWNISSFSYGKLGEESYTANIHFELYYRIVNKE